MKLLKKIAVSKNFWLYPDKKFDIIKVIMGRSPLPMIFYSTKFSGSKIIQYFWINIPQKQCEKVFILWSSYYLYLFFSDKIFPSLNSGKPLTLSFYEAPEKNWRVKEFLVVSWQKIWYHKNYKGSFASTHDFLFNQKAMKLRFAFSAKSAT